MGEWVGRGGRGPRSWWRLKPSPPRWERGSLEKLAAGLEPGGGRGPAFLEQQRRLHQHVVHSGKHRTRWARHPCCQVNHQPGASPAPADRLTGSAIPSGSPAARGQSGKQRSFLRERPRPTRDLAPSWAAPRPGAQQRDHGGGEWPAPRSAAT